MILYTEEKMKLGNNDAIVLDIPDGSGYIYVTRSVYDQALLLNERFEGDINILRQHLRTAGAHIVEARFFADNAPKPLNILAPFLGLIDTDVVIESSVKEICGVLNQLAMTINFNNFTKVPYEVRADVKFSKSIVADYERVWEDMKVKYNIMDLDLSTIPMEFVKQIVTEIMEAVLPSLQQVQRVEVVKTIKEEVKENIPVEVQAMPVQIVEEDAKEVNTTEVVEAEEEEEDPWAIFDAMVNTELEKQQTKEQQQEDVKVEDVAETASELTSDKDKELQEIDKLLSLMNRGGM